MSEDNKKTNIEYNLDQHVKQHVYNNQYQFIQKDIVYELYD